jgi:hypothetical protein
VLLRILGFVDDEWDFMLSTLLRESVQGAPHGILGGPWPTQKFLWVGHNAFGPPKKCRCKIKYFYCFLCLRNFFINFRLDSIVRLTVSILPADCGVAA